MNALTLSGILMLGVGILALIVGARPPYNARQQEYSSLIETSRIVTIGICALGLILLGISLAGMVVDA